MIEDGGGLHNYLNGKSTLKSAFSTWLLFNISLSFVLRVHVYKVCPFLHIIVLLERIRCVFANFSSNNRKKFRLLGAVLSDKVTKSFSVKVCFFEVLVFLFQLIKEIKYLPEGFRLTVAFKIQPPRFLEKWAKSSFVDTPSPKGPAD